MQHYLALAPGTRDAAVKGTMRSLSEDSLVMPARVLALLSCGKKQRAFEVDTLKHGLFFHHVLEGLRGKAPANCS